MRTPSRTCGPSRWPCPRASKPGRFPSADPGRREALRTEDWMSKRIKVLSGVLVAVALAACQDPLTVQNTNNPDRLRVLARPSDLEALIAGTFKTSHNATTGANGLEPSASTMSWENASNLANWGLGPRSAIPRSFIDNARGN